MKITVKQLKKIIKEQVEEAWRDTDSSDEISAELSGTFSLTIELGNEGMKDKHDIARVLSDLEQKFRRNPSIGVMAGSLRDVNGNRVGQWAIED